MPEMIPSSNVEPHERPNSDCHDSKLNQSLKSPVEAISYGTAPTGSVWGEEIAEVRDALVALRPQGTWLNLCAGDGRYNDIVVRTADNVLAVDLDEAGLARLIQRTDTEYRGKIQAVIHDVTKKLPFADNSMDGVLCNGAIHLFSPKVVAMLCCETLRILRPGGTAVIDFSFDIRRQLPDGTLLQYPEEHSYSEAESLELVTNEWSGHEIKTVRGEAPTMPVNLGDISYLYSSKGFLFVLTKNRDQKN